MQNLNVSLIQSDILWERRDDNLKAYASLIEQIKTPPDLIVLPEMFATGFSMNASSCAEKEQGPILAWMKDVAKKLQCVIMGSAMISDGADHYNRLFWVEANGAYSFYDKRHLFRFGGENEYYTQGNQKILMTLKGWIFCPLICYDLRFPVWSKNTYKDQHFEYDCLIYIANWPERRAHHWKSLLTARAIENLSYCIGVNRVGTDGNDLIYSGNTMIVDPQGLAQQPLPDHQPGIIEVVLEGKNLQRWRTKFNVGQDWDSFEIR
jgi:omega-amidase